MNDNKLKKQRKLDKAGSHFLNISTVNVPTWRGALAVHHLERCIGSAPAVHWTMEKTG